MKKATDVQIFMLEELARQLKLDPKDYTDLTFDEAYKLIETLSEELREVKRTIGHVWTEEEVRSRLKCYNDDDSIYYAKVAKPKDVVTFGSGINIVDNRIIKRIDLDRGIEGALLVKGRPRTAKEWKKFRLYWLIRHLYVYDIGITEVSWLMNKPKRTLRDWEAEAVAMITGYLNKKSLAQLDKTPILSSSQKSR